MGKEPTMVRRGQDGAERAGTILVVDDNEINRAVLVNLFSGTYQVNDELLKKAAPGCLVLHCLPARRGLEITDSVFEAHADEIFEEAENRLHAQKAVLTLLMG